MPEETKETEEREPKTDDELKQIAQDLWAGKIYSDRHIPEEQGPKALQMVFMPLSFMHPDDLKKFSEAKPAFVYEYIDKAGPRSCNGMPNFFSFQYLDEAETERMFEYFNAVQKAMEDLDAPPTD